ncbi:TPA: hypothetical protein P1K35_002363 [Providencia rettgeri]
MQQHAIISVEANIMKTPAPIKDTAQENVLIKKRVLSASKYQKAVIQYTQKKANIDHQKIISEKDNVYQIAHQQGYSDGIKQLLADFIEGIDCCETAFQKQVNQSAERLEKRLVAVFSDDRIKDIVASYFLHQQKKSANTKLYVPTNMQHTLNKEYTCVHIQPNTSNDTIAIESNNEIHYFSPLIAAKKVLPQILAVSTRCQILEKNKKSYQELIELVNNHRGNHDPIDQ